VLDSQALGEARMVAKRKLAKCLLGCSAGLAGIFLIIIGDLLFFYYHSFFDNFLGVWLVIMVSSFFYIEASNIITETRQNPNAMKRYKTVPLVKQLIASLPVILLLFIITAGIMILWLVASLVISGNIAKPIYDLMFVSAFIMYVTATTYGIWWGKKRYW